MGCKQYARMLGLSRGYPYILYLSLSKWDAAPSPGLFHRGIFREYHGQKIRWHDSIVPPRFAVVPNVSLPGRGPNFGCRSRHHLGSSRAPALQIRNGKISSVQQGPLLNGGAHGYVDILKNFTRRDSQRAVGGLYKIVTSLSAMFASERIPELQGTGELPGPDQKSRAINLPFAFCFTHVVPPLGEGRLPELVVSKNAVCRGWIFCEGENESTRDRWCGQSPSSVQNRKSLEEISAERARRGNAR